MSEKMTLQEIGEGIENSFKTGRDLAVDGNPAIIHTKNEAYISKSFMKKYGSIVQSILRKEIWDKVNDGEN